MNGLPRCGVPIVIRDSGAYSLGLICDIRWRQSSPPMECARRLTPRPRTFSWSCMSRVFEREVMEPVLGQLYFSDRGVGGRGKVPWDGGNDHFGAYFLP